MNMQERTKTAIQRFHFIGLSGEIGRSEFSGVSVPSDRRLVITTRRRVRARLAHRLVHLCRSRVVSGKQDKGGLLVSLNTATRVASVGGIYM